MDNFVIISGCSSGGKSTVLAELHRRGHAVVEEPGRRIVKQELETGGTALPWHDPTAFMHRVVALALTDLKSAAKQDRWVFFDRGLIDAACGLEHITGKPVLADMALRHCFHRRIFLVPPWPEIYVVDAERRHGFSQAVAEYERLLPVYRALGYELSILAKASVSDRADFIEEAVLF